jgi:hypothetical protein
MRIKTNRASVEAFMRGIVLVRGDEDGRAAVVELPATVAEADVEALAAPLLRARFERGETFPFDPPRFTGPPAGYAITH